MFWIVGNTSINDKQQVQQKKENKGKRKKAKIQKLWSYNPKSCGNQIRDMLKL
jgi:hypothetical protein